MNMSKTFIYLIVTVAVYLLIVKGLSGYDSGKKSDNNDSKQESVKETKTTSRKYSYTH